MAVFHYGRYRKSCLCRSLQALSQRKPQVCKHILWYHFTQPNSPSHVSVAEGFVHLSSLSLYSSILLQNNLIQDQDRKSKGLLSLINTDATQNLVSFENYPTAAAEQCMDPYDLCSALPQHGTTAQYLTQIMNSPCSSLLQQFNTSSLLSSLFSVAHILVLSSQRRHM